MKNKTLVTGDSAVFINQDTKETQGIFEVVGYNDMAKLVVIKKDGEPFKRVSSSLLRHADVEKPDNQTTQEVLLMFAVGFGATHTLDIYNARNYLKYQNGVWYLLYTYHNAQPEWQILSSLDGGIPKRIDLDCCPNSKPHIMNLEVVCEVKA